MGVRRAQPILIAGGGIGGAKSQEDWCGDLAWLYGGTGLQG